MRTRFDCPSAPLTLKGLLIRTRRAVAIALVFATGVHLVFTQAAGGLQAKQRTAKPLTTQFVKREPRLTKPLEMKKRPQPKPRRIQRRMVAVQAKVDRRQAGLAAQSTQMIRSLSKPHVDLSRTASFMAQGLEPQAMAEIIEGERESKHVVDMSLEMMDIEALDTGRYRAMVVFKDAGDRRSIYGYFHLIIIYSETIEKSLEAIASFTVGGRSIVEQEIRALVQAVNRYTDIEMDVIGRYSMDSREFLKTPFVMVESAAHFDIIDQEAQNIGKYLTHGGFIFSEVEKFRHEPPTGSATDLSFRDMYRWALATQGLAHRRDWLFEKLPNDHPVYTCYFDFNGPPIGQVNYFSPDGSEVINYLEGITLDGRLVAIHSNKDMSDLWYLRVENTRVLQFAVNMVVFALTQEGSITHQSMHHVE